jgi:glycosyltransferase involved in cell wall biosynthesis
MKLIYVSWITSPFWLELFEEYHSRYGVNCKVIECQHDLDGRGKHWEKSKQGFNGVDRKKIEKGQLLESFLNDNIIEEAPDLVMISGFDLRIMRYVSNLVKNSVKHRNLKILIVAEQPNKANRFISLIKRVVYRAKIAWFRPDAILAIGLRAYDFYLSISGKETNVCEFPYFQNNAPYQVTEDSLSNCSGKLNLLFCGQLIKRNNPQIIVEALRELPESIRRNVILRISGGGPLLREMIKDLQGSGFDMNNFFQVSEFDVWEERMTYYTESHILICPANHSGWGLVIPEALSCSVVLLVTEKMETARYFLRER